MKIRFAGFPFDNPALNTVDRFLLGLDRITRAEPFANTTFCAHLIDTVILRTIRHQRHVGRHST